MRHADHFLLLSPVFRKQLHLQPLSYNKDVFESWLIMVCWVIDRWRCDQRNICRASDTPSVYLHSKHTCFSPRVWVTSTLFIINTINLYLSVVVQSNKTTPALHGHFWCNAENEKNSRAVVNKLINCNLFIRLKCFNLPITVYGQSDTRSNIHLLIIDLSLIIDTVNSHDGIYSSWWRLQLPVRARVSKNVLRSRLLVCPDGGPTGQQAPSVFSGVK